MKLSIVIFSTVFVFTSSINVDKKALNKWYAEIETKIKAIISENSFHEVTHRINIDCIKTSQLDLTENGEKVINFAQAMIAIYGAGFECFSVDDKKFVWKFLLNSLITFYNQTVNRDDIICFRMELRKFNPNEPLAYTINEGTMKIYESYCKSIVDNDGLDVNLQNIQTGYGSFKELTCGAVNIEEMKRVFFYIIILSDENKTNENIRNRIINFFNGTLKKAFKCVMDRIAVLQGNYNGRNIVQDSTVKPLETTSTLINPNFQNIYQNTGSNSHQSPSFQQFSSSGSQIQSQFSTFGYQSQSTAFSVNSVQSHFPNHYHTGQFMPSFGHFGLPYGKK